MKAVEIFRNLTTEATVSFREDGALVAFLHSIYRTVLQHAVYASVEYMAEETGDCSAVPIMGSSLLSPADGDLVSLADELILAIRRERGLTCCRPWDSRGAASDSVKQRAFAWVRARNDTIGHGVFSKKTAARQLEWLPGLIEDTCTALEDILPETLAEHRDELALPTRGGTLKLEVLRLRDGQPLLLRAIERRGAVWRARFQSLRIHDSDEYCYEIPPDSRILGLVQADQSSYTTRSVYLGAGTGVDDRWAPMCRFPSRQASRFVGRESELVRLADWYDDQESRVALIFGEGGVGKTTLVLEFLHRLIEGRAEVKWKPEVIAYFSAKETAWDASGYRDLRGALPSLDEAIRIVAMSCNENLDKGWYREEGVALVQKAEGLLQMAGLGRGSVLCVIDNTETLARSQEEERRVADVLRLISRRIGRILLTSRRREYLEAFPIEVERLGIDDAVTLLRELASEYGVKEASGASDEKLRSWVVPLGGRPLLIDAMIRVAVNNRLAMDGAARQILRAAREDLGVFLYQDAWDRVDERIQDTLVALAKLGGTLPGDELAALCAEVGGSFERFIDAINETRLCNVQSFGRSEEYVLESDVRSFLDAKFRTLANARKTRIGDAMSRLRERLKAISAVDASFSDRIAEAFRTKEAKAAKVSATQGQHDMAIALYEEALVKDPNNVALLERFAWYLLMRLQQTDRARETVDRALQLDPNYSEACFTRGLVAARERDMSLGESCFSKAEALGKPAHVCKLQRAKLLLRGVETDIARGQVRERTDHWLREAEQLIEGALIVSPTDAYDHQHMSERRLALDRSTNLASRMARIGPRR